MPALKTPSKSSFLQLAQWIVDPIGYMESSRQECGDVFIAQISRLLPNTNLIFVSDPQVLQRLFTRDRQEEFSAPGSMNKALGPLAGATSVLMLEGDYHRKRRQLLMPSFHGDRLRSYGDLIVNLTQRIMDRLAPGELFTARSLMQDISLQVIMEVVFGLYEGERYEKIKVLLAYLLDIFSSPINAAFILIPALQKDLGNWSPWGKFMRVREEINHLLYTEIAERRQQSVKGEDILSMLLDSQDEDGNALSDLELKDELFLLLFAGHETTATAMSWSLYWSHYHPEVKAQILAELATPGPNPEPMNIARLSYLGAVCQETLRICPVGMLSLPRLVEKSVEVNGYSFEPGNIITGCIYLTHHDEKLYPEPQKFKPERFLERQPNAYEFIPFGGGARRCIGEALAQFEMKLVLATILAGYELRLGETKPEKPRRRGVTLAPARGVKMIMQGKRNPEVLLQQSQELVS
jgi:cytochrome P450